MHNVINRNRINEIFYILFLHRVSRIYTRIRICYPVVYTSSTFPLPLLHFQCSVCTCGWGTWTAHGVRSRSTGWTCHGTVRGWSPAEVFQGVGRGAGCSCQEERPAAGDGAGDGTSSLSSVFSSRAPDGWVLSSGCRWVTGTVSGAYKAAAPKSLEDTGPPRRLLSGDVVSAAPSKS